MRLPLLVRSHGRPARKTWFALCLRTSWGGTTTEALSRLWHWSSWISCSCPRHARHSRILTLWKSTRPLCPHSTPECWSPRRHASTKFSTLLPAISLSVLKIFFFTMFWDNLEKFFNNNSSQDDFLYRYSSMILQPTKDCDWNVEICSPHIGQPVIGFKCVKGLDLDALRTSSFLPSRMTIVRKTILQECRAILQFFGWTGRSCELCASLRAFTRALKWERLSSVIQKSCVTSDIHILILVKSTMFSNALRTVQRCCKTSYKPQLWLGSKLYLWLHIVLSHRLMSRR